MARVPFMTEGGFIFFMMITGQPIFKTNLCAGMLFSSNELRKSGVNIN